jgi:cytochrome c oxidase subunit 2
MASTDVIHSFWVPPLGGKRDAIPGSTTRIVLTPDTPGEYYGQCAEFCGASHANMRHRAVVETPEAFTAWVAVPQSRPHPPDGRRPPRASASISPHVRRRHTVRDVSGAGSGPTSRTSARARRSPAASR